MKYKSSEIKITVDRNVYVVCLENLHKGQQINVFRIALVLQVFQGCKLRVKLTSEVITTYYKIINTCDFAIFGFFKSILTGLVLLLANIFNISLRTTTSNTILSLVELHGNISKQKWWNIIIINYCGFKHVD